jgi:CubicO group peptidase (beta-lactamase class C family)
VKFGEQVFVPWQEPRQPTRDELRFYVEDLQEETRVPGIGVMTSTHGRRVTACVGTLAVDEAEMVSADTQFHLGCLTKLMISVVVLELAWEARLDLGAPLQEYLPELRGTVHGSTVVVAHLLSHTGGYRGTQILDTKTRDLTWDRFVEYLGAAPQQFAPGDVFSYEHTGAVLIGEILRRVTAKESTELVQERIFGPLGLSPGTVEADGRRSRVQAAQHRIDRTTGRYVRTSWAHVFNSSSGFPEFWRPSFSTYTLSLKDLLAFGEALIGLPSRMGDPAFSPATLSQIQRPMVRIPPLVRGVLGDLAPVSFGLGAARYSDGSYGLGSVSVGQCFGLRFDPGTQTCVAVGLNATHPYLLNTILRSVCDATSEIRASEPEQRVFNWQLTDLAGTYRGGGSDSAVAVFDKERLVCDIVSDERELRLSAELVIDDGGHLVMQSSAPTLSLGFFREPASQDVALMIWPTAYKRVSGRPRTRRDGEVSV